MVLVGGLEQTYYMAIRILNIDTAFELAVFLVFGDEEQSRGYKMGQ